MSGASWRACALLCALLWVQLRDTAAKDFNADFWRPSKRHPSAIPEGPHGQDRRARLQNDYITTCDVVTEIEEYQPCRQEWWTLFQVAPETLENCVHTVKVHTNMCL